MADISDPKSLSKRADDLYQEGDFESAARLYGEAASAFGTQGMPLDAAEMKNNQSVAFLQAGDAQASFDAAAGTAKIFSAAGDVHRQGVALANEGTALESLKRADEAIEKYLQSAEAFKQSEDDQLYATVMQAIAGIHLWRGKVLEALTAMQVGLSNVKEPTFKQKMMRGLLRLRLW